MFRNQEKKVKKARHEAEKSYVGALASLGNETGEYVGDGQGEAAEEAAAVADIIEFDTDDSPAADEIGVSDEAEPLLIFYDCEATGFSIYQEHIIEIAAEVYQCPVPHRETTFSSLIKTARRIQSKGIVLYIQLFNFWISLAFQAHKISATMIRCERPLSVVFPLFLRWIETLTVAVTDGTGIPHYPGQAIVLVRLSISDFICSFGGSQRLHI